jgi:hypothetical protein
MNTIDALRIYQQIISSPPDVQASTPTGQVISAYSKDYIHRIITSMILKVKEKTTEGEVENE